MNKFLRMFYLSICSLIIICGMQVIDTKIVATGKVYNNGDSVIENNHKLYFTQSGKKSGGIFSYDLKKKKRKRLVEVDYPNDNIYMIGKSIIYSSDSSVYRLNLSSMKTSKIYSDISYSPILGVNKSSKRIYVVDDNNIKELKMDGTCTAIQQLQCDEIPTGIVNNNYMLLCSGSDVYYGTMKKGLEKIAGIHKTDIYAPILRMLGTYGDYVYGYIYDRPGTMLTLYGNVFQISLKTGKVKIFDEEDMYILNNCTMTSGKVFINENDSLQNTICYVLNKKGKIKKKKYPCPLDVAKGNNIYYENNNSGQKGIICYNTKTNKKRIVNSQYKDKAMIYYSSPNNIQTSMKIINGKLFFTGFDCSSGRTMGWK